MTTDEEVPDSEPERVAAKLRIRELRRAQREALKALKREGTPELNSPRPPTPLEHLGLHTLPGAESNVTPKYRVPSTVFSLAPLSPPPTSRGSTRDSASPPPRIFDGSQFAYVAKPVASRFRSISSAASVSSEGVAGPSRLTKPAAPRKRAAAAKKTGAAPVAFAISEDQWKILKSCVICDEAWTSRKGPKGKADHMKKCSREYFIPAEVAEARMLEQLASIEPAATALPEVPHAKKTLLDDELATRHPPPRRRARKQAAVESIGPATGNWDHILGRSDATVPSSEHAGGGFILPSDEPDTQRVDDLEHMSEPQDAFPSTQLPAPSRFAPTKPVFSLLGDYFGTNVPDDDAPPPTQVLPQSKLASRLAFASVPRSLTALVSEPDLPYIPAPTPPPQSSTASLTSFFPSRKTNFTHPRTRPKQTFTLPLSVDTTPTTIISISSDDSSSNDEVARPEPRRRTSKSRSESDESAIDLDSKPLNARSASKSKSRSPRSKQALKPPSSSNDGDLWFAAIDDASAVPVSNQTEASGDEGWGEGAVLEWDGAAESAVSDSDMSSNAGLSSPRARKSKSPSPVPSVSSPSSDDIPLAKKRPIKPSKTPKLSHLSDSDSDITSPSSTKAKSKSPKPAKTTTATKSKSKAKAKTNDYIPLTDPSLDTIFTQMIQHDEQLHLRVLRYEPVNFDVFLQKALACNVNPRGLMIRLRTFLDSQCIHFQPAAAPGGRQRRRTKKKAKA